MIVRVLTPLLSGVVGTVFGGLFVLTIQHEGDLAEIFAHLETTMGQHEDIFESQEKQLELNNKLALSINKIAVLTGEMEKTIEKIELQIERVSDDVEALKRRVDRLETERKVNER